MRYLFVFFIVFSFSVLSVSAKGDDADMDRFIDSLMSRMTLEEKAGQTSLVTWDRRYMTGDALSSRVAGKIVNGQVGGVFNVRTSEEKKMIQQLAVEKTRLGIPLLFGLDVVHGYRTIWPIPLALSCSWDMDLIERTARAAADEATSEGIDWTFSPMVDIVRDPRWGRVAESSGEDPYLGSRVAEAMVRGYQGEDLADPQSIMACVKHFALYGAGEGGRDYDAVDMSTVRMYQTYLPPYKAAVDAGAGSVMSSFNDINNVPATADRWLLTDLLRGEWGFDGFVVSDYTSVGELSAHGLGDLAQVSSRALKAGLDMDMVSEGIVKNLDRCIREGLITEKDIDRACRRVLEAKYRLGLFEDPYRRMGREPVDREKYRELALEAARKSIVLLKNDDNVLPLEKGTKVALIGPLTDTRWELMGTWAGAAAQADEGVSIRSGISRYTSSLLQSAGAPVTDNRNLARMIGYDIDKAGDPDSLIAEAVKAAMKSDVVVAVLGETAKMSGESSSMTWIGLQPTQRRLLEALVNTGKDVVLVLLNGRPMTLEWENEHCAAIVDAWAPGLQGGNAVADVLFGEYNPSGRLTMTFPRNVGQIPVHYDMKSTGRPYVPFRKYRTGYIDCVMEPLYPFGYGLSYTDVSYSDLKVDVVSPDSINVAVTVCNTGDMSVEETVQLYVGDPVASVTRPVKELKAFRKITLAPDESAEVSFVLDEDDLKFWNNSLKYVWEPGKFIIEAGPDSKNTLKTEIRVDSGYDIFLCIGQSNMAGRGEILPEDRGTIDGVWILDDRDSIVPAAAPLNRYSTVRKNISMQGINPAYSFCKEISAGTGRKVLLVVNARGGSSLDEWMKSHEGQYRFSEKHGADDPELEGELMPSMYEDAVRRCREAMKYGQLKAILWHQGESDSSPAKAGDYADRLKILASDLREDLGAGDVPFVIGEVCRNYSDASRINQAIHHAAEIIPNCRCVSSEGCGSNPDNVHFSRSGQLLMGHRYAAEVFDAVYEN